jgi:prophage regulatory protein
MEDEGVRADHPGQESLLRLPEVMRRVGLKKAAIYAKIAQGEFPRPVAIGLRARAWRASDIEKWIAQRRYPDWKFNAARSTVGRPHPE